MSRISGCIRATLPSDDARDAERGEECGLRPVAMLVRSVSVAFTSWQLLVSGEWTAFRPVSSIFCHSSRIFSSKALLIDSWVWYLLSTAWKHQKIGTESEEFNLRTFSFSWYSSLTSLSVRFCIANASSFWLTICSSCDIRVLHASKATDFMSNCCDLP